LTNEKSQSNDDREGSDSLNSDLQELKANFQYTTTSLKPNRPKKSKDIDFEAYVKRLEEIIGTKIDTDKAMDLLTKYRLDTERLFKNVYKNHLYYKLYFGSEGSKNFLNAAKVN